MERETEVVGKRDRGSLKERDRGNLKERQRYIGVVRKRQVYDVKHKVRLLATLIERQM